MPCLQLERFLHNEMVSSRAYPSLLNFGGFPRSVSVAVNDVAANGVADETELVEGDVVSVEVATFVNGFHGECIKTFVVGEK